jgi:hypothetical protein
MYFVAFVIMIASTYVGLTDKIKTSWAVTTLLCAAAISSSSYLYGAAFDCYVTPKALTVAMSCSIIAAFIWLTRELYYLCGDE